MKHAGKAQLAALRLILLTLLVVAVVLAVAFLAKIIGAFVLGLFWTLVVLWVLFAIFTFYFFRDPEPQVPAGPNLVVAPGTGKVDAIDSASESQFMGGDCQRISIFLSVFDVHVQRAPVSGRVAHYQYTTGQFLSALRSDSAVYNENLLLGFEAAEPRGEKVGVRLIAGLIARRIVPWVAQGDDVKRGERISLIQFGSRVDVYLPRRAEIKVKLGDRVVGGETIVAGFK
jgi:phosphatidylserine decarboxylase